MNAANADTVRSGGDMITRSKTTKTLNRSRRLGLALSLLLLLPGMASATTFSFGDIDATDQIQSIIIVGESSGVDYTASTGTTGTLLIDGYISTINFVNKAPISIDPNTVTYSSQLDLTVTNFIGPAFSVAAFTAELSNGVTDDFSIIDTVLGLPVLGGDYDGPMDLTGSTNSGLVLADFDADVGSGLSGDADVLSAFGTQGVIEFQVIVGSGSLCTTILTCPGFGSPDSPALNSFSGPPNGSMAPVIPEPSTALLVGVGLAALTVQRRWGKLPA